MKTPIAICYDFDGTLSPKNMQEYGFIEAFSDVDAQAFWDEAKMRAKREDMDQILSYMHLMKESEPWRKKDLEAQGKKIVLFPGVERDAPYCDWFSRINDYAEGKNAGLEHYIISSGIKTMIAARFSSEGFKKNAIKHIFACDFIYDEEGKPTWPAAAINYTTKTQYLFRINKGVLNQWDDEKVNTHKGKDEWPIPFSNMIYFGDGDTDIPAMKMITYKGGHAIAVYDGEDPGKRGKCRGLLADACCQFIAEADYSPDKKIERLIRCLIEKITTAERLRQMAKDTG